MPPAYSIADNQSVIRCPQCQGSGSIGSDTAPLTCPLCLGDGRVSLADSHRYHAANPAPPVTIVPCPACAATGRQQVQGLFQTCSLCHGAKNVDALTADGWSDT